MTQTGSGRAKAASHGAGGVVEATQEENAARVDTRRSRVDDAARGQQQQQQQQHEHVGWQVDRDRRMVQSLVNSLLRVLEGPSAITSSEVARPSAAMPSSHHVGGAAEDTKEHDAAGVDRKRPRVDDDARVQQQQQQQGGRVTSSTPTNMVAIRAGQQPSPSVKTVTTATSIVLTSPDLMLHIMGYMRWVTGEPKYTVKELGELALVCRAWRDAAQQESLWESLAKVFIPRLADVEDAITTQAELRKAGGSYRRYLVQYGRLLSERYVVGWNWDSRLVLQFEIWDEWPVHYLFSGEGALSHHELDDNKVSLALDTEGGPLFSAASRSGPGGQYGSINEYLEALESLKVRVTVHDEVTGRRAVLWDSEDTVICDVHANHNDEHLVTCDPQSLTTVSCGPMKLDAAVEFRVSPSEEDIELSADQKRYEVVPFLTFEAADDLDALDVGRLIWSALGY